MKHVAGAARLVLLSIAIIAVVTAILLATGNAPGPALRAGLDESLGDWSAVTDTAALALPLVVVALGTGICFRAGMFNLGGEGQLVAGALAAAVVGTELAAPTPVHLAAAVAAGAVAGSLPALLLAALRAWLAVDEVLSTLMSNFLVILLAQYLVTNQLRDPTRQTGTTRNIAATARFSEIFADSRLTWAVIAIVIVAVLTWWLVEQARLGAALRMVGLSPGFSLAAGLPVRALQCWSMALAGGYAGLAGAIIVTASQFRFWGGIGSGLGFTAVLIALLANNRPLGAIAWSLIYTFLTTSARGMELETDVPAQVTDVALAVVLLAFSSRAGLTALLRRLRATIRPDTHDEMVPTAATELPA